MLKNLILEFIDFGTIGIGETVSIVNNQDIFCPKNILKVTRINAEYLDIEIYLYGYNSSVVDVPIKNVSMFDVIDTFDEDNTIVKILNSYLAEHVDNLKYYESFQSNNSRDRVGTG